MAKRATHIVHAVPTEQEIQDAALERFRAQLVTHADSIATGLDVLQALHDAGILDILRVLLHRGEDITKILVDQARKPEYAGGIKNIMTLVQGISAIDTEGLGTAMRVMAKVSHADAQGAPQVQGIWDLLRVMKDPDVAAGLSTMLGLLKLVGASARQEQEAH